MYGKTVDEFEYRGEKFRWVISPNRYIYQVWHGSELVGGMPVSQVRNRIAPEAIKALYPLCDAWIEKQPQVVESVVESVVVGEITTGYLANGKGSTRVKEAKAARAKAKKEGAKRGVSKP